MTDRLLELNDPVTVDSTTTTAGGEETSSSSLEGIVAHLGSVQFASGDDDEVSLEQHLPARARIMAAWTVSYILNVGARIMACS